MQVHLQLMLVPVGLQLQLFLAENRLECWPGLFQTQVVTPTPRFSQRSVPNFQLFEVPLGQADSEGTSMARRRERRKP
jgi:hypothetical protein